MGLYIHVPYCEAKCHYCDFNSYAGREREFRAMAAALVDDLETAARGVGSALPLPLGTVFIGGGTPSVLPGADVARLIEVARQRLGFAPDVEITSEANPGSLTADWLEKVMAAGLNRLSLGVQSLDDAELARLGRVHTRAVATEAVRIARRAGVCSVSIDLIFGLPEQTVEQWRHNLEAALALETDHISLYGLIVESGTAFGRRHAEGTLVVPDDDVQAEMYDIASARMRACGYEQYEISNYARPGHRCRHNALYWRNEPYLGVGPGAVSYLDGWRHTRCRNPVEYVRRVRAGGSLTVEAERVSQAACLTETIMLGLRTRDGLDLAWLCARFPDLLDRVGLDAAIDDLAGDLRQAGMLRVEEGRMFVDGDALMVSNGVMERFLDLPALLTSRGGSATLRQVV